jgi:pilus assembly protein Flp/PilA
MTFPTNFSLFEASSVEDATMRYFKRFLRDEQAATAVEYAVMLAAVLMVILLAVGSVGAHSGGMWSRVLSSLLGVGF